MRIGFTGSSGQGKTSTARALVGRPEFMHYDRVGSTARSMKDYGLNKESTPNGQMLIMMNRIRKEMMTSGCYVSDRTPLDSLAYTLYQHHRMDWGKSYIDAYWSMTEYYMEVYDHIFYFPVTLPVRGGAYREQDPAFHKEIDLYIQEGLSELDVSYTTMPKASIEERADFIRFKLYNDKYT